MPPAGCPLSTSEPSPFTLTLRLGTIPHAQIPLHLPVHIPPHWPTSSKEPLPAPGRYRPHSFFFTQLPSACGPHSTVKHWPPLPCLGLTSSASTAWRAHLLAGNC